MKSRCTFTDEATGGIHIHLHLLKAFSLKGSFTGAQQFVLFFPTVSSPTCITVFVLPLSFPSLPLSASCLVSNAADKSNK